MPLMTYGGVNLLVRNGQLTTHPRCCCSCPVGQLAIWAYYFTDADQVEVNVDETTYVNEVLAEFNGKYFGYELAAVFWVGNPDSPDPVTGKTYYGEFQIWLVAYCCDTSLCDDFYYEDKAETFANDWSRITDPASQFEWDPPWNVGSCSGATIESDAGLDTLFECVRQSISFPSDPATGEFVKRESIEVCCNL